MAARERDGWLGDFSLVLSKDHFRSVRHNQEYEVFSGSKPLALLWLIVAAGAGGALGGTLVSGALWGPWWQVPAWIAALVVAAIVAYWTGRFLSGPPLDFMAGWSLFWGLLIGAVAMWGAQPDGAGWAYGIAGGIGFLVGITQGVYEPDDLHGHDGFFAISMIAAPAGACLAAWLYRHGLLAERGLASAALAGTLAGLILLGSSMAYFFSRLDNLGGLNRLASLLLHRDETSGEAIAPLNAAIRLAPGDASLFDRRALAHALSGNEAAAERDWARVDELAPGSIAPTISRGWLALRRDRPSEAAALFEQVARASPKERWAWVGLAVAKLKLGDAAQAIAALEHVPGAELRALDLTYLAEALLALGDAKSAERTATDAIDELDSIHGRSWIVRAEARRLLGDIDGAAKDYNMALSASDEPGIEQRALDGLEAIDRPIEEIEIE
jgi:tetratricopeptide (TPR) repeat protein